MQPAREAKPRTGTVRGPEDGAEPQIHRAAMDLRTERGSSIGMSEIPGSRFLRLVDGSHTQSQSWSTDAIRSDCPRPTSCTGDGGRRRAGIEDAEGVPTAAGGSEGRKPICRPDWEGSLRRIKFGLRPDWFDDLCWVSPSSLFPSLPPQRDSGSDLPSSSLGYS